MSGTTWTQYGIISSSVATRGVVTSSSYTIYTNIILFREWIEETVASAGNVVMTRVHKEKVNLECSYGDEHYLYTR